MQDFIPKQWFFRTAGGSGILMEFFTNLALPNLEIAIQPTPP